MTNDKKNVFVYLRGDKEHGKEIIEYLESLGGASCCDIMLNGTDSSLFYYIGLNGDITCDDWISDWMKGHYEEIKLDFKYQPKDKELVWCWDWDDEICAKEVCFYDAKNNRTFSFDGTRNKYGGHYANYAPFEGEYPDWAKEALTKLED